MFWYRQIYLSLTKFIEILQNKYIIKKFCGDLVKLSGMLVHFSTNLIQVIKVLLRTKLKSPTFEMGEYC